MQGVPGGHVDGELSTGHPPFKMQPVLLNPCATPLYQNDQHDDKEHAGYNPDNRGTVHVTLPSF